MKTIQQIVDLFGGMERLVAHPIRVEVPGYMRLVIEHVGRGPRGGPLVSAAHYFEQHGDLMVDPEITFELIDGGWCPVSFQQASLSVYHEAIFVGEDGKVRSRPKLLADLKRFAAQWDRNLRDQGFLDAAQAATTNGKGDDVGEH